MLMTLPMPSFCSTAQSRIATHSAPDCEMTEIFPGGGTDGANVAFIRWCVLKMPRQFGPMSRTPRDWQSVDQLLFQRCALGADFLETGGDDGRQPSRRRQSNFGSRP